ncbi:MAG TPA: hypothetical protein VFX97_05280 [Pyrinomonadaceae bacterium]|nr:hypothetical protein [Pyrinomonadaceae bacterium]
MNFISRIVSISAIVAAAAVGCASQQKLPPTPDPVQRVSAEETFDLNIVERRITENDFFAATSVGLDSREGKNLSMNVGVEVRAGKIDVLMRNVTGTVRFRGSIQKVLDRLNSRPARPPR